MTNQFEGVIPPSEEEDLSGAGFKVPRTIWTITDVTEEQASDKNGEGVRAIITYTTQVDGREVSVKDRVWKSHSDTATSQRAAGDRKRLYIAVFGGPKGALNAPMLVGKQVSAEGLEDDAGFRKIRGLRAVQAGSAAGVAAAVGGF